MNPVQALVASVVLGLPLLVAPASGATRQTLPRSTADRPDDRTGSQVHALYVLPADGDDRAYDTDGTVEASISNLQSWLRGQTGGNGLRIDTYQGQLDVGFVRSSQTDAAIASNGAFVRDVIERELRSIGFTGERKIYAVYYDGTSTFACGGGAWPPALPGTVGAVYLRATFGQGFPCYDATRSRSGLQIMDHAVLHELLHTIGMVPTCAPHHTRAGHVSDSPADLMYAGDEAWAPAVLDHGRDDYFQAPVPGCADLADSPFLEGDEPAPAPVRFRLSVSVAGSGRVASAPGGLSCRRRCTASFGEGATVRLRAFSARGWRLAAWTGACKGTGKCTVRMTQHRVVRARFAKK